MLVVVKHLLAGLGHLVPHVLDLRHSLKDKTQRPERRIEGADTLSRLMSSYAKGLRHHEFDRNSTVCTPSESSLAGAGTVAFRHEPVPLLAQVPDWMPTWTLRFSLAANGKTPLQTCTRVQDQTPLPTPAMLRSPRTTDGALTLAGSGRSSVPGGSSSPGASSPLGC